MSAAVERTEWGTITVAHRVIERIAARAAGDNPDVGAPTTRVLGVAVPGTDPDLAELPKTTVEIDGTKAFISLQLAVRWPVSVPDTTTAVRAHVRSRVHELTGLDVDQVSITVADLATDIAPPSRVK